jgi:hypothetical protein
MQVHGKKSLADARAHAVVLMGEQVYVPCMSNTQAPAPAAVRLRTDAYAAWMSELKLASEEQQAAFLGVGRATVGRAHRGEINPGGRFIAACLAKFTGTFEQLFEVAS